MASSKAAATTGNLPKEFFFGWDLLYKTIECTVNKKTDVLISLVHFMLVKHSNLRCVGVGEDKTLTEDETGSELLPDSWNANERRYALRYVHDNDLYLMLGHISEDTLIVNLMNVKTKKVSNIGLDHDSLVKKTKGSITEMIPDVALLVSRVSKELVNPVFTGTNEVVTAQTTGSNHRNNLRDERYEPDPLRIGPPLRPAIGSFASPGYEPRPFGFPDVGRSDLDPLGHIGPGNLMTLPPRPSFQGQPRFDPFGPPGVNFPQNPNPDHMRPPYDDYYM